MKKPRKLSERQIAKILREYGFERRATEIMRRLEAAGLAWNPGRHHERPRALTERGPFYSPAAWREWVIATKAGFLGVSIHDDWLACVFDDDAAGERFVNATRPSGKWNHHAFAHACHGHTDRTSVIDGLDHALDRFVRGIGQLTGVDTGPLFEVLVAVDPPEEGSRS